MLTQAELVEVHMTSIDMSNARGRQYNPDYLMPKQTH